MLSRVDVLRDAARVHAEAAAASRCSRCSCGLLGPAAAAAAPWCAAVLPTNSLPVPECSDHWSRERFLRGELLCSCVASHLSPAAEPTSCASCACVDPVRACFACGRWSVVVASVNVARRFLSLSPWRLSACASSCRSSGVCSLGCCCCMRADRAMGCS